MSRQALLPQSWQYVLLGVLLWIVVDWGTAGGFRIAYFLKYGPTLLLFYVGYPLVFSILAFRLRWSERCLFGATLAAIFLIEVVFVGNPLLTTFPAMIGAIPLAVAVYSPLTFFPLWFVRGQTRRHWRLVALLIAVELVVMALTTIGKPGS